MGIRDEMSNEWERPSEVDNPTLTNAGTSFYGPDSASISMFARWTLVTIGCPVQGEEEVLS